ncbi:mannan endo-1,6-alpha-mannosidase [Aureobasidium pullulans]|nr:mannan endo-1,6-alpha-mannosidase [Aureobasidium pullulans]
MYFEKWGFMLIFWNLAGVPLSYCHCTLYIANHDPSEYHWPTWALVLLFITYLFVYWIWDTANSQKNMFRAQERGVALNRKTFPQLPWKAVENPVFIKTRTGDSILCDGWYGKARKIHYTCDLFFALSWGAITGFHSPFPWFYPFFFSCMIVHRAIRDIQKCRAKYGDAWMEYEKRVPWLFIPGLMAWYAGNNTGGTPGILPGPYYWWEAGGMFGHMINYWYYTGDDYYNSIVSTAIQFQVGTGDDFLPANQTKDEGNDDQVFWAFTAMDAAELNFPESTVENAPSWLSLAQAVFNEMAGRWDTSTCGGGLRWQIYTFNAGYDYKNSISNLGLFQLAARLARYTNNATYTDWAEKSWQWYADSSLWDVETYQVFDGTSTDDNCTSVDHFEWTYNYAAAISGAAYMYNHTSDQSWLDIVEGLLNTTVTTFFPTTMGDKIMVEITCQPLGNCDTDQLSFRSYLARTLAVTTQLIPSLHETIYPYLRASAQGAAAQCDGGNTGAICGMEWNTTIWDGTYGVGQEMSALAVIQSLMLDTQDAAFVAPLTASTGGNSTSNPSAGTGSSSSTFEPSIATRQITTGDRAGAAILTILILGSMGLMFGVLSVVVVLQSMF